MKFCSQCGNTVSLRIPEDDNRERFICDTCHYIHYTNPRIITGCLPIYEDKVLLCKRAIEPRKGWWTLPAGFMENGETSEQGAIREAMEEANANLKLQGLYTLFNLPSISQVYFFYRAQLTDLNYASGSESLEVKLFSENEIPWDELAFPVIHKTLTYYFTDRVSQQFPVRCEDVEGHLVKSATSN